MITLREIQATDNEEMANVIRRVMEEHGIDRPGSVYTDPTTDNLYELFRVPHSAYYIAELNGKIVGGCGYFPTANLPEGTAELVKLYVSIAARGKKLGKRLMEHVATEAKKDGYSSLYLESMPELTHALNLYHNLGYERLKSPLGNSGHFACDIWMVKNL